MVITVHRRTQRQCPWGFQPHRRTHRDRIVTALVIQKLRALGFTVYDTTDDMGMTPTPFCGTW